MSSTIGDTIVSVVVILFVLLNCNSGNLVLSLSASESLLTVKPTTSKDQEELKSETEIINNINVISGSSQPSDSLKQDEKDNYVLYNLEDFCNGVTERGQIHIRGWKAAILQVNFVLGNDGLPASRKIHKCKVDIKTDEKFWLVAAIEHMKIRGKKDSSNKWICSDYVQFSSPGSSLFNKIFSIFNIDGFKDRESEKLCGEKKLDGRNLQKITDISTDANSFSTTSEEMSIYFHQDDDEKGLFNNSFRIILTTYQHASEEVFAVACEGKQKCYGSHMFCIDPSFICDGHVNCAFPGSGTDEQLCNADERPSIFNMTTVIIVTLLSMVGLGIVMCVIITVTCRIRSRMSSSRRRSTTSLNFTVVDPSAPRLDQEGALPRYETVILSDSNNDSVAKGEDLEIGERELPPKYESLFPEGPPEVQKEGSNPAS